MELFSISCTTCQQRLKVHDEAAIGDIQICPKCGSMVLVEAPAGWQADSASEEPPPAPPAPDTPAEYDEELDKETVVDPFPSSDFSDVPVRSDPMKGGGPTAAKPPEPEPTVDAPPEPVAGSSIQDDQPASPAESAQSDASPDEAVTPPPVDSEADTAPPAPAAHVEDETAPILPTDDWTSESARQRRQLLLIAGAAIAGVALAIGLLGFFASRAARQDGPQTSQRTDPAGDAVDDGETDASVDPEAGDPPQENGEPADDETEGDESTPPDQPDSQDTPDDSSEQQSDGDAQNADQSEEDSPPASPTDATEDPAADSTEATEAEADTTGQEQNDDNATAPQEMQPAQDESDSADDEIDAAALAATIDAFAPFIDMEKPPAEPAIPEAKTIPSELDPDAVLGEPTVPRPKKRTIDIKARLADKVLRVQMSGTPLRQFLRFLSDFSTIPMTIDPDALALLGHPPQQPVTVQGDELDTKAMLDAALKPLGLTYVEVDSQLLITRPIASEATLRTVRHPVDDLAEDEAGMLELSNWIIECIEPDAWDAYGGSGSIRPDTTNLAIKQQDTILFRAIVFCERLRAARGLPHRSNFNPAQFALTPRFQRADKSLTKTLTLNYVQPTRFEQILDSITQESGTVILVDWTALSQQDWNPDAETTLSLLNAPLSVAMNRLLDPMALTYRVIDENTLQVTTREALKARLDIEFYPLADVSVAPASDQSVVDSLVAQLGEQTVADVRGLLFLDGKSRHLIAALPQPHQRRLAELWAKLPPAAAQGG